ncbi:MAG: phosphatase PAP2 family protein [Thalassotalea sp.]
MNVKNDVYKCDLQLLLWCVRSHSYGRFIAFIRGFSKSGDGYMQVLLPCVIAMAEPASGANFLLLALLAFAIERPIYFVLKRSLKRRRPPEVIPYFSSLVTPSDQFSFPSGHTMAAFLLAGLCCLVYGATAYPLYIWATCVGCSRVILGVHFPTDILAGACLGSALAYLVVTTATFL